MFALLTCDNRDTFGTLPLMTIKEQLEVDLKTAMLSGDKTLVTTLRGLKAAILTVEVAKNIRTTGLPDNEVIELFTKEAKKRQESADLFAQGGNTEKSAAELLEKQVIARYLPEQMSDEDLLEVVERVVTGMGGVEQSQMGQAIGAVKKQVGASVEGSRIAAAVKARLK